jgi:nicotinate-nucleotide adenylyltransferase
VSAPDPLPRFGDGRMGRVGLYGGSFNPAHRGHAHVAAEALRRLRLDALWVLVSPQNPLKPRTGMAPLADRLASARAVFHDPRIVVTAIEARIGTRYTADTLAALKRRFRRVQFVFVMGADSFASLPRWDRWHAVMRAVPIAVMPRPGFTQAALRGPAARAFAFARRQARFAPALATQAPPGWVVLQVRQDESSATRIREGRKSKVSGCH